MSSLLERMAEVQQPLANGLVYDDRGIGRGAVFSDDAQHRLIIDRHIDRGATAAFVGVQPSRAGAENDDQTILKLYGFWRCNGFGRLLGVNLTTFISPDVGTLATCEQAIHPEADKWIIKAFGYADTIVVGWGRLDKLPPRLRGRWREIVAMAADKPLGCLGTCEDGHPRHPARIGYDTPLVRWSPPQ